MNKSTILTWLGVAGVIGTGIATAKAAPKAAKLLEEAELEKGSELTTIEKVKTAGPVYIPAILLGASTIGCILGANVLNQRTQASMASAYALLDNSYKEYRNKVDDIYGDDADSQVLEAVANDHRDELDEYPTDGKVLFFDYVSCRYFEDRMENVLQKITMDDGLECYILTTPFDNPRNYYIY